MPKKKQAQKKSVKKSTAKKTASRKILVSKKQKDHSFLDHVIKIKTNGKKHDIEKILPQKDLSQAKLDLINDIQKLIRTSPKSLSPKTIVKLKKAAPLRKTVKKQKQVKVSYVVDIIPQNTAPKRSAYILDLRKKASQPALKPKFKKSKLPNKKINLCYKEEILAITSNQDFSTENKSDLKNQSKYTRAQFTSGRTFELPLGWKKTIIVFMALAFLFIAPFTLLKYYQNLISKKDTVTNITSVAYEHLLAAGKNTISSDLSSASQEFNQATQSFSQASQELDDINIFISTILNLVPQQGKTLDDAQNLLAVGQNVSLVGEKLTISLTYFQDDSLEVTEKIAYFRDDLTGVTNNLNQISTSLNEVNIASIPNEYQEQFLQMKKAVPKINNSVQNFIDLSEVLIEILGKDRMQRFLLVFQNDSELRATGGFIGSFALLDIDNGKIRNLEIPGGGSYDLKGSLTERVISPQPLHLINPHWQFQDANWFADFPTSAEKLEWFYEKSGGPTVDGVIAINASFFQDLLHILGPIEMPEYEKTITANNFYEQTQQQVEYDYDKEENKPKQFIADLAPRTIRKIFEFDKEQILDIAGLLNKTLQQKDILIYLNNPDLQTTIDNFHWSGRLNDTLGDYLAVINTNIAGGKTDNVIDQQIEHTAEISNTGEVVNTLKITRTHLGSKVTTFKGVQNVDYLRVYVPQGSQLVSAEGFSEPDPKLFKMPEDYYEPDLDLSLIQGETIIDEQTGVKIHSENNKTVFGNWVMTDVGQTSEIIVKYRLPFKVKLAEKSYISTMDKIKYLLGFTEEPVTFYSLLVQKQPGDDNTKISTYIKIPDNLLNVWKYPLSLSKNNNIFSYATDLNSDKVLGLIFQKK